MSSSTRHQLAVLLLLACLSALLAGCGGGDDDGGGGDSEDRRATAGSDDEQLDEQLAERNDSYDAPPTNRLDPERDWFVEVETSAGSFTIELLPEQGPLAAANFHYLVEEGFYDGVRVHRIVPGFVIQAGDPLGDGTGGPGYAIKDDPVSGKDPYQRGVVAMANAGPDTGGSQFFIVLSDEVSLPPSYAVFGRVDEAGMKVVDEIAETEVEPGPNGEQSSPVETVRLLDLEAVDATSPAG